MPRSRWTIALGAFAVTLLVGAADYVTGVEITFTMLYLFPVAASAWLDGPVLGGAIAVLATACAATVAVALDGHGAPGWLPLVWNTIGTLAIFGFVVGLVDALRRHVEREREGRRIAVEQLRHAERLHVIGAMAAGVAHELGTPLSVIGGSAELLESDALGVERARELGGRIRAQAAKMAEIIRHLLDFGRRGGNNRTAIELDAVARDTIALLAPTARRYHARIQLDPAPGPLAVRANAAELEQVVSNLLLNAMQAMRDGGVIDVRTSVEARVDAAGRAHAFGAIAIEDRGTGIAPADLPRIFDPFFTTKDVGEGTGLGLSVSYGIVHDHGGAIEVTSALGRGSCFTVLLPLDDPPLR